MSWAGASAWTQFEIEARPSSTLVAFQSVWEATASTIARVFFMR